MKSPDAGNKAQRSRPARMVGAIESHLQRRVLAGLLELVPLIVTIIVLLFIINKADGYVRQLPFVEGEPWDVTGIGIVALIVAFYIVGSLVSVRLGRWIITLVGQVLLHVPVVKVIYRVMLQVTSVLASDYGFSRVVFIEWPREGMVAMGFVTGRVLSKDKDHSLVSVYIPTVPNPTSGNMAFIHEDDVMETDLSVDAAMKLVFSGGFVIPDDLSMARLPRTDADIDTDFLGSFESEGSIRARQAKEHRPSEAGEAGVPAVGGPMPKGARQEKPS